MAWISVITDNEKQLTKHFSKDPETGELVKTAPEHLTDGHIEALNLTVDQLGETIQKMTSNQCLCLGVLQQPGKNPITCNALRKNGTATRSKEFLDYYPEDNWLLLDFDDSGLEPQEALDTLATVDPQFKTANVLVVPSSSSYLYDGETQIIGPGNFHLYVPLKGIRNPSEYGHLLFDSLVLKGLGKPYVTKAGTILIKTLFDKAVLSPEREIYVAPPICQPPLRSDRFKEMDHQEGHVLNPDLLPELTPDDMMELRLVYSDLRNSVQKEAEESRKKYNENRAKTTAQIKGTNHLIELANIPDTPTHYDKQGRPIVELLSTDVILDENGSKIEIRDLILDPKIGLRLPDPLEPYKRGDERKDIPGKGIATMLKPNMIYSHHHAGIIYLLRWAPQDLIDYLSTAGNEEKTLVWKQLSIGMMEISSGATDGDISELADAVKTNLQNVKGAGVPKEKKHVLARLKPPPPPEDAEDDLLLKMNSQYGMAKIDGKTVVISEAWREAGDSFQVEYATPGALDAWTKNMPMRVNNQVVSAYKWWEQHPERLTYESVEFIPDSRTFRKPGKKRRMPQGEMYNLFQGYVHDPAKATECDLILDHLKEVWCAGIQQEYDYVIGWMAHMMQKPAEVSRTALVMQSDPGIGKGIIIENIFCKVFGIHAIATANSDDLTGRFNSHLGVNLFFYANELSYTAQASVKSILKSLVTDADRTIEAKNVNKIKAKNYSSVIFSSNEDWMLNLGAGDRRYVYLTTSSHRVGQKDYFIALLAQIENGGREAFTEYLLNYDLSVYNPEAIPNHNHKQKVADFLRSAHPSVRMVWSLLNKDVDPTIYATHTMYNRIKTWRDGSEEMQMSKMQFFDLYTVYCDYYKVDRKYDDAMNISTQLEAGGVLKRETDPRTDYPLDYSNKDGKQVLVFKPFQIGTKLLKV